MMTFKERLAYEIKITEIASHVVNEEIEGYKVQKLFCYGSHVATVFIGTDGNENFTQVCNHHSQGNMNTLINFLRQNNIDAPNEQFVKTHYFC